MVCKIFITNGLEVKILETKKLGYASGPSRVPMPVDHRQISAAKSRLDVTFREWIPGKRCIPSFAAEGISKESTAASKKYLQPYLDEYSFR